MLTIKAFEFYSSRDGGDNPKESGVAYYAVQYPSGVYRTGTVSGAQAWALLDMVLCADASAADLDTGMRYPHVGPPIGLHSEEWTVGSAAYKVMAREITRKEPGGQGRSPGYNGKLALSASVGRDRRAFPTAADEAAAAAAEAKAKAAVGTFDGQSFRERRAAALAKQNHLAQKAPAAMTGDNAALHLLNVKAFHGPTSGVVANVAVRGFLEVTEPGQAAVSVLGWLDSNRGDHATIEVRASDWERFDPGSKPVVWMLLAQGDNANNKFLVGVSQQPITPAT